MIRRLIAAAVLAVAGLVARALHVDFTDEGVSP